MLQRPVPAGGPMRVRRMDRGRLVGRWLRRDEPARAPPISDRNGAKVSFVISPAHTRSHSAANRSASVLCGAAATMLFQKLAPRFTSAVRKAT